jgi:hypothetical protein
MAFGYREFRSNAHWGDILDQIDAAIAAAVEQAPEPTHLTPPPEPMRPGAAHIEALDERLNRLQASVERAERCAAATDALLQAEAEAIRRWNEAVQAAREELVKRTSDIV